MGRFIYKKHFKLLVSVIQIIAAGVLVYCLLNLGFWIEDTYSLGEMAQSYEETPLFFEQVDAILEDRIQNQKNHILFETNGEINLLKEIDIQSFEENGEENEAEQTGNVRDMNTSYSLADLISFYESGMADVLKNAIRDAETEQSETGTRAGDILRRKSEELETILPSSGYSLAEYADWHLDPATLILKFYKELEYASREVGSRYQTYSNKQSKSRSVKAPSNLAYCIENTVTGELYTNTGAPDYRTAVSGIIRSDKFVPLFEGQRSYNIMVTNPERVLNKEAENWFMDEKFIGSNEKVFFAVNMDYPVSDNLQSYAKSFAQRGTVIRVSAIIAGICLILLIGGFVLSMLTAGWDEGHIKPRLYAIDQIPTELLVGLFMIITILYILAIGKPLFRPTEILGRDRLVTAVIMSSAYCVFLTAACSFVRRIRSNTIWSNSVSLILTRTWKQITSSRTASIQILIAYIGFFVLNFVFLLMDKLGIILIFILDVAALLFILRNMAGKQNVWEGIHQISKGDLKYKIDTSTLQGETLEMAKAVNEMGDGLAEAVDAIIKNERLKAELITNVSHDIKTPLTSIVNYVDLLKRENLEGERVKHYIDVLDQKSQRLKQLTEDLVEASKISSGNVKLELMRMPLQSIVRQACGEFQERLEEHGLTYEWQMEKEVIPVMADGKQLWRVFENLLGNIYKYAKEDTTVSISLRRQDEMAIVEIRNVSKTTLTITGEELAGRFVRGDKSRNTEGSGLGLSIAQSLVELHGGKLKLSVEGDLFCAEICLPVAKDEEEQRK